MDDLIIIKDSLVVRRSNILRMSWQERHTELEVKFGDPAIASNGKSFWTLVGEEAFELWEKFTGQRVSWDTRPEEE